mmetsp:Transcript_59223/g.109458  ORF Transcript_59223/g.109458 Transcript_59223/m.109458 type:complete len:87 (-) Transcript_59223:147-407(-)
MQSMSTLPGGTGTTTRGTGWLGASGSSNRNVDIQLVGAPGVGKTFLLEELIKENDLKQLEKFNEQKAAGLCGMSTVWQIALCLTRL